MKKVLILGVMLFAMSIVQAQTPVKEKTASYKAAEELMATMNMDKMMNDVVSQMIDMQIAANPMLAAKKDAFKSFMLKYMSWSALKEDYIKIYTDEFTEADLKNMTAFYKTPTGQKVASKQTTITMKGAQLGQEKVQAHMSELQDMMK